MNISTKIILFLGFIAITLQQVPQISQKDLAQDFIFIQIYQNNCPNCQSQLKELNKIKEIFQGLVKVGKIKAESLPPALKSQIKSPSMYVLYKGSLADYVQYSDKISRISIAKFILAQIEKTVKSKDKKLFGGNTTEKKESDPKGGKKQKRGGGKDASGVVVLTDNNFQETVLKSQEAWFIEFYSPSCGHCQALQPQWDKLPGLVNKKVNIAKIDATQNRAMAQKYQIKGFPTLFLFPLNNKESPIQYSSERTAEAMVSWLNTQNIGEQKREFTKLTLEKYQKECNKNIVCLIFIMEKKSELKSLDFVEDIMEEQKKKPLRFFYSPRLQRFEQDIMIEDRATPKLVSVWDSINSYKVFNGSPNKSQIDEFISKIMERRTWIKKSEKIEKLLFHPSDSQQL